MKISILLLLLTVSSAKAADSPLCQDLYKFSCAPGAHEDGTGIVGNDQKKIELRDKTEIQIRQLGTEKFGTVLSDPGKTYFRSQAISGLGLAGDPVCASQDSKDIAACNESLKVGLVKLTLNQLEIAEPRISASGHIADIYLLKESAVYLSVYEDIEKQVRPALVNADEEKKVKDEMVPDLKNIFVAKINALNIDDKTKEYMAAKVGAIEFSGSDCGDSGGMLSKYFSPNAQYFPAKNTIKVCLGILQGGNSAFDLAFAVGHELAHAIDPCNIGNGPETGAVRYRPAANLKSLDDQYPIPGLVGCLRSSKSAGAMNRALYVSPIGNNNYNPQNPPPLTYCSGNDQITDSMADFFGVELLTDYIKSKHPNLTTSQWQVGYSNAMRSICSKYVPDEFDSHPLSVKRINGLLLANPAVRKKMNCQTPLADHSYCDLNNPSNSPNFYTENTGGQFGGAFGAPPASPPRVPVLPAPLPAPVPQGTQQ